MKIYFAASIRGGRDDQKIYEELITLLRNHGTVLTEHFGKSTIKSAFGTGRDVEKIYKQDMAWVTEADVIVAEVTQPSLGVGYEIAKAENMGKRVLCLYRPNPERSLSAMIAGNKNVTVKNYRTIEDAADILTAFFNTET